MAEDRITILAIDDSEDILFAISAICDLENWKTITTTRGEEACLLMRTHRPNLVLVDYHMPSINGIEVVRNIRRMDDTTPILVLTVEDSREVAGSFMEAGASDFALKPIKPVDLISRIRVHLNAARPVQADPPPPQSRGIRQGHPPPNPGHRGILPPAANRQPDHQRNFCRLWSRLPDHLPLSVLHGFGGHSGGVF